MTRAEILNCLTDRPCEVCRFHESGKCERWDCVFEEKPDDAEDCEDKRMTREEAIKALKYERKTALHENKSAFDMAIKSLSAEPCEDAISRAEAMTEIMMFAGNVKPDEEGIYIKVSDAVQLLRELPSVTPKQKPGKWILLSDKDLNGTFDFFYKGDAWMNYECSNCGHKVHNGLNDTLLDNRTNYCPNCGAKMEDTE